MITAVPFVSNRPSEFVYKVNDTVVYSNNFTEDTELNCVTVGFVGLGKNKGFLGRVSVKFGPDACKWSNKYRVYTNFYLTRRMFNGIPI